MVCLLLVDGVKRCVLPLWRKDGSQQWVRSLGCDSQGRGCFIGEEQGQQFTATNIHGSIGP
jgi:hypothetical protein